MVQKKQWASKSRTAQPMNSSPTSVDSTQETKKQKVEPTGEKIDPPRKDKKVELREEGQATDSLNCPLPPFVTP